MARALAFLAVLLAGCSNPTPTEIRGLLARCEKHGLEGRAWNNTFHNGVTCSMPGTYAHWNAEDLEP